MAGHRWLSDAPGIVNTYQGIVLALHEANTSALWGLATVIVIICSLPVVSAIVTENLM